MKYITSKDLDTLDSDIINLTKYSAHDSQIKRVGLTSSSLQGLATKNGKEALLASSIDGDPVDLARNVCNFLSSDFMICSKNFSTSASALDQHLQGLMISQSISSGEANCDITPALKIETRKGESTLHFPAIQTCVAPSIDVIIPVHNDRQRLERAIRSILTQRYDGTVNIIIVDDASIDNPEQIVRQFDKTRYIRLDKNMGTYSARNTGLNAAVGDLVTFQDSDDISLPYRLARTAHFLSKSDADLYIGTYLRVDDSGRIVSTNGKARRIGLILLAGTRDIIGCRLGGFDRVRGGADSEFIERAQALGYEIFYDDVVTYLADHDNTGLTSYGSLKIWDSKGRPKRNKKREAYVSAYRAWHQSGALVDISKPCQENIRQFPVSASILDGSWSAALPVSGDRFVDKAMQQYCILASPFDRTMSWADSVKQARFSAKPITAVIVSNRGGDLVKRAFRQVRAFRYSNLQILYVANSANAIMASDCLSNDIVQIEADAGKNLGHCLNLAARAADGEYLFKIDDDDFYGPDYASETIVALENGYDFVGKQSVFYYFEDGGEIILRPPDRYLQQTKHLSGATFAINTDLVRNIGFSETLQFGSDANFIKKAKASGVIPFSTSPFNFSVGRRTNSSHTWRITRKELLRDGHSVNVKSLSSILEPNPSA